MTARQKLTGRPTWRVEVLNRPAEGKGHDRFLCANGFLGVADGATPLQRDWPDAGAFAARALDALWQEAAAAPTPGASPEQIFRQAIETTAAAHPGAGWTASCAVAVAHWHGDRISVAVLGDCVAVIELIGGRQVDLVDPAVPALDAAVARMERPEEARARRLANRRAMNRGGAYWVFADAPEAAEHLRVHTSAEDDVLAITLRTDGATGLAPGVAPTSMLLDDATSIRATRGRSGPGRD